MNVLQAIEKISELKIILQILKKAESAEDRLVELGFEKEHTNAVNDMKMEVIRELEQLESRLGKTRLSVER